MHLRGILRQDDQWLNSVVEHSSEIVTVVDTDGTLRYANPAWARVLGYDPEEAIGTMNVLDHVHPEDLGHVLEQTEEALAKGSITTNKAEYRFRRKDGSWRWLESVGTYLLDNPAVGGVVVLSRDITERKKAEKENRKLARQTTLRADISVALDGGGSLRDVLQRCTETMTRHLDAAFVRIWTLEEDKDVLKLQASAGLYTHTDGFHGRVPVADFKIGLIAQERLPHLTNDVVSDARVHDKEWVEREGMVAFAGYPLVAEDTVVGVLALFSRHALAEDTLEVLAAVADVIAHGIQRKRTEDALRKSEERFRLLAEHAQDIVYRYRLKPTPGFEYVSPSAFAVVGYTPEEHYADPELARKIVHPDDRHLIGEALRLPESPVAVRWLRKDGEVVWTEQRNKLIYDEAGELVAIEGIARDVTERKRVEEALRETQEFLMGLLDNAPLPIYGVSEEGRVRLANRFFADFVGMPREEVVGSSLEDVFTEEEARQFRENNRKVIETGSPIIEEEWAEAPDGLRYFQTIKFPLRDPDMRTVAIGGISLDVTKSRRAEKRLRYQAYHDLLTDLPNRRLFVERLEQALRRTERKRGSRVAVLFLDLDNFKVVNDSLGHELGDKLLVAVAARLRTCVRSEDTLARFGGDEFTVLLEEVANPEDVVRMSERIVEKLREPFAFDEKEFFVAASMGIALSSARLESPEELLRNADAAMYRAKEQGILKYEFFDRSMYEQAIERLNLENDLRRALDNEEFVIHYQPIVSLGTGKAWGLEALLRWQHPDRGLLSPSRFVAVAEETGLIVPIGSLVMEDACVRVKEWQRVHPRIGPLSACVNFSGRQLEHPHSAPAVEEILRRTGLQAGLLHLDITETAYIRATAAHSSNLAHLKKLGGRISIDDFGMGYSSLSYLKRLPADILKVDKSFVAGLGQNVQDKAIVQMVIDLAHTFGMEAVAEGVESKEQAELLREMGCDMAQGFYFAKPLPPEEISAFLTG